MDNKTLTQLSEVIAKKHNVSARCVKRVYFSFFEFIKIKMDELPPLGEQDEAFFKENQTNFSVPLLGKFITTKKRVDGVNKRKRIIQEKIEEKNNKINKNANRK